MEGYQMDPQEQVFDNVKFEKARAVARYNRLRKTLKLLHFLSVVVVLLLISWSSTHLPGALKVSSRFFFGVSNHLLGVSNHLLNPHAIFLTGNVIIVALFVLFRGSGAGGEDSSDDDLYADYVRHSQAHSQQQKVIAPGGDNIPPSEGPAIPEIKDVIAGTGCGDGGDAEEKQAILCSEAEEEEEQRDAVTSAIETAAKQIEKFQRTQSEKLKQEIAAQPREELRWSETLKVGRGRAERPKVTSFDTVDKLSNEEFNLAIDAFIKRQHKFIMEQKLAEN